MHSGVRQPKPGKCPKCGMTLLPEGTPFGTLWQLAPRPSGWRRLSPWAFGVLLLLALILVVLHLGTVEEFTRLAWAARFDWFVLACVAQAATYVSAALVWRQALRRAGHPRSMATLVPLGIAKLFTDQVVPSGGVSGAILVAKGLARRRVPTKVAMAVLLVGLVSYFGAYLASALTCLGILWLHDRANAALFVVVAIFVAIVIAIPSGVLWMKRWGHRLPAVWVKRLPGAAFLLRAIAEAPIDLLRDPILLAETGSLELAVFARCSDIVAGVSRLGRQPAGLGRLRQLHRGIHGGDPRTDPAGPGHIRGGLRRHAEPSRRRHRVGFGSDAVASRAHLLAAYGAGPLARQA
jgi:hypothetical protein